MHCFTKSRWALSLTLLIEQCISSTSYPRRSSPSGGLRLYVTVYIIMFQAVDIDVIAHILQLLGHLFNRGSGAWVSIRVRKSADRTQPHVSNMVREITVLFTPWFLLSRIENLLFGGSTSAWPGFVYVCQVGEKATRKQM